MQVARYQVVGRWTLLWDEQLTSLVGIVTVHLQDIRGREGLCLALGPTSHAAGGEGEGGCSAGEIEVEACYDIKVADGIMLRALHGGGGPARPCAHCRIVTPVDGGGLGASKQGKLVSPRRVPDAICKSTFSRPAI